MTAFSPKNYQSQVLENVETYFKACHELPSPSIAFTATTERLWGRGNTYNPLSGFPTDMPYFCLRVPTGGGKTWLAAKSVALVNTLLLRCEHSVILWLVPSRPIREQTLRALRNRQHPYHTALREAGPITILDLEEAKSVTRATLDTSTTIIVATRQAFQVEEEECRKVYQSSGALMHHFDNLSPTQRDELLTEGEGVDRITPYSLANVLRLGRPFVVVDEAHNNRTELAFDMLARFRPGGVMELSATPDLERTPSNVLHSVSAAELKAEEMIKLPVVLETEPNWQQGLAAAIGRRDALHKLADDERRAGAAYLRPLVLIQSEPRRAGVDTLDFERVRNELITNHGIPASEIIVATGEEKGLEQIDAAYKLGIADPGCPVKFVITQKALAEGWDCPFAYILVSMASLHSAMAVEQLLGRVLRQPGASHRQAWALNQSYAFVVSHKTDSAKLAAARMPLLEVFIGEFLRSVEHIVKRGLRSDYTSRQDNLFALRGKLLVSQNLHQNLCRADRFFTEHDEFSTNRPENRLLHSALRCALLMSASQENQQLARELCFVFADVPSSSQFGQDFQRLRLDRGMGHYADALAWARLILEEESPLTGTGRNRAPSLLFPMEAVFEAFVANHLARQLALPFTLKTQARCFSLLRHQEQNWFRLKPDLLVRESVSDKLVLDTKWKLIDGTRANGTDKYGLAQADFYQLHAYGHSYLVDGTGDVVLIYPKTVTFRKPLDVFDFPKATGLRLWVLPFYLRERTLGIPKDAPFAANFNRTSIVAVEVRENKSPKLTEGALT